MNFKSIITENYYIISFVVVFLSIFYLEIRKLIPRKIWKILSDVIFILIIACSLWGSKIKDNQEAVATDKRQRESLRKIAELDSQTRKLYFSLYSLNKDISSSQVKIRNGIHVIDEEIIHQKENFESQSRQLYASYKSLDSLSQGQYELQRSISSELRQAKQLLEPNEFENPKFAVRFYLKLDRNISDKFEPKWRIDATIAQFPKDTSKFYDLYFFHIKGKMNITKKTIDFSKEEGLSSNYKSTEELKPFIYELCSRVSIWAFPEDQMQVAFFGGYTTRHFGDYPDFEFELSASPCHNYLELVVKGNLEPSIYHGGVLSSVDFCGRIYKVAIHDYFDQAQIRIEHPKNSIIVKKRPRFQLLGYYYSTSLLINFGKYNQKFASTISEPKFIYRNLTNSESEKRYGGLDSSYAKYLDPRFYSYSDIEFQSTVNCQ